MNYFEKYQKYKAKYLHLRTQFGGTLASVVAPISVPKTGFFALAKKHAAVQLNKADEWNRARKDNCNDPKYDYLQTELSQNYKFEDFVSTAYHGFYFDPVSWNIKKAEALKKHISDHIAKKQVDKAHTLSKECIETIIKQYFGDKKEAFMTKLNSGIATDPAIKILIEKKKELSDQHNKKVQENREQYNKKALERSQQENARVQKIKDNADAKAQKVKDNADAKAQKVKDNAIKLRNDTKISFEKVIQNIHLFPNVTMCVIDLDNIIVMRNYTIFITKFDRFLSDIKTSGDINIITNILKISIQEMHDLSKKINQSGASLLNDRDTDILILLFFETDYKNRLRINALEKFIHDINSTLHGGIDDMRVAIIVTANTFVEDILKKLKINLEAIIGETADGVFPFDNFDQESNHMIYIGRTLNTYFLNKMGATRIIPAPSLSVISYKMVPHTAEFHYYNVSDEKYGLVL